jgi:aminoglycoside phosphotransferase (APT) family kinase protein
MTREEPRKMHADEVETDAGLVRRLLAGQFPDRAGLPIERVPSSGTDNALYRLGQEMVVRLPRIHWAVAGIEQDFRWLPVLAPRLPVETPVPLAKGAPAEDYPWEWGVYSWLEGENPTPGSGGDGEGLAEDAARFIEALHAIDLAGGPPARRGVPLEVQDEQARAALIALRGIDTDAATAAWEEALEAPPWSRAPVWVHGDLLPGNLLLRGGRLTGVIDWAGAGVGDPACDLIVAWGLLPSEARPVFGDRLGVDDATWARGRGWALSLALIAVPYYKDTNPEFAATARRLLDEVLADYSGRT